MRSIILRKITAVTVASMVLGTVVPACPTATAAPILAEGRPAGWEESKAYTAWLVGGTVAAAKVAADIAKTRLADAQRNLSDARALASAARGLSAGTLAALAAEVVSAQAVVAASTLAAEAAVAVAAGLAVGTGVGQLANAGIAAVWDLFASSDRLPQPVDPTQSPIYIPPSPAELRALTATLIADVGLPPTDFEAAGASGAVARRFVDQGAEIALMALRGAAAGGAGRADELLSAAADLVAALTSYRATVESFATIVVTTAFQSPVSEVANARSRFEAVVAIARSECAPSGRDCTEIDALLNRALSSFAMAEATVAAGSYPSLVGGSNPVFRPLTLSNFRQFLENTALFGVNALPGEEVTLAERLVAVAGVLFPNGGSFASAVAQWDALGDSGGRQTLLFPPTGSLLINEVLYLSATTQSCGLPGCVGPWLRINPYESQLAISQVPEAATIGLVLVGLGGTALIRWRNRGGQI